MAQKRKSSGDDGDLFIEGSGQLRLVDKSVEQQALEKGKVECLGMTFDSEDARRAYFTDRLREKLADPEFRKSPGFPKGTDEDIVRMSDAPWYTACPNPFLADFVRVYGKPYNATERYDRDPFAVDVSVGKTDALFKAHSYHTKVPYLAIVPSILHYTDPGDLVLDGFSGSGMTGVAAQWSGSAPLAYRRQLEQEFLKRGEMKPNWGARRVILSDLSPAATFIASGFNLPFDAGKFGSHAIQLFAQLRKEVGWMYETRDPETGKIGEIRYTVWSEIFSCPECSGEINFVAEALSSDTQQVQGEFPCPHCHTLLTKKKLDKFWVTDFDPSVGQNVKRPKRAPVLIRYSVDGIEREKKPDSDDLSLIEKIRALSIPANLPTDRMMHAEEGQQKWGDKWRSGTASFTNVHHLFMPRSAQVIAALWKLSEQEDDSRIKSMLLFLVEQTITTMTLQNRFQPQGFKQVNKSLPGVYYIPSHHCEVSPWYAIESRGKRIAKAFLAAPMKSTYAIVSTGDCGSMSLPESSIDYIFTDPPFGANFAYAELNFITEAWHKVFTHRQNEAIVSGFQQKGIYEYQELMRKSFDSYFHALKPGRWMTVVFSNSSNAIWRAIQEAMGVAGFVVADVRTLDKKHGSFNQVIGVTVDQDLVISAYKPTLALIERFRLGASTPESAWAFIAEHLGHVPVFSAANEAVEVVAERTAQLLHDRMVAFHVQRQLSVPLSTAEFLVGLNQRYPERDGMYFLATQVAEYDRKRNKVSELRQLTLFVIDEASAIQWVRRELQDKPRSFQDLQPAFMREIQNWAKHEQTVELKEILRQNCIHYDGNGPVPSQIHSYLSTNFKELRNLAKDDPALTAKAADRWYVPDPGKQGDLEKLREKALLTEFETYKHAKERKLKLFRTEAVRAGFKAAYEGQDYKTIVSVAAKLPENVLQEDEKLLMYYDVASMRLGDE